jgi:hypothetical protein
MFCPLEPQGRFVYLRTYLSIFRLISNLELIEADKIDKTAYLINFINFTSKNFKGNSNLAYI